MTTEHNASDDVNDKSLPNPSQAEQQHDIVLPSPPPEILNPFLDCDCEIKRNLCQNLSHSGDWWLSFYFAIKLIKF